MATTVSRSEAMRALAWPSIFPNPWQDPGELSNLRSLSPASVTPPYTA